MKTQKLPTIRAHLLHPYVEAIAPKGAAAIRLMRRHGINPAAPLDPYARVSLGMFLTFAAEAASLVGDPLLGLHLGGRRRPEHVGALGLLLTTAPTFKAALTGFSTWVRGIQEGTSVEMRDGADGVEFSYRIDGVDPWMARQDVEFSLASICNLIRARMGEGWSPLEVHFEHASAGRQRDYEWVFQSPVYFGQTINMIVIRRQDLDHVCLNPDHAMTPFIEHHLRVLSEEMGDERQFAQRVGTVVARLIGKCPVTLDAVAAELAVSVRSLQRRLYEEQVTFRDIVRRQRRRIAETLLRTHRPSSVMEAAISAGYADGSCLSRAFKAWTGTPPSKYVSAVETMQTPDRVQHIRDAGAPLLMDARYSAGVRSPRAG